MKQDKAKRIVEAVLTELQSRGGFDHWWYEIDPVIREEIRHDLAKVVQRKAEDSNPNA